MTASKTQVGGDHYLDAIQPWDVMQQDMSEEEFRQYLRGNVLKYIMRYRKKGGLEDLQKAQHYLTRLIETYDAPKKRVAKKATKVAKKATKKKTTKKKLGRPPKKRGPGRPRKPRPVGRPRKKRAPGRPRKRRG